MVLTGDGGRDSSARGGPDAFPFDISNTVAAGATETKELDVPFDGRIIDIVIGWQAGANGNVGVRIDTKDGTKLLPRNSDTDYIGANDFTYPFTVRRDIDENDVLVAEFNNTDTNNSHFVNVIPEIVKDAGPNK